MKCKFVVQIDPAKHHPGRIEHTVGWPLPDIKVFVIHFIYALRDGNPTNFRVGFGFLRISAKKKDS